jgi:hypothetical protein
MLGIFDVNHENARQTVLNQICENLKAHNLEDTKLCIPTAKLNILIEKVFPIGTDINNFRMVMNGVNTKSIHTGSLLDCKDYIVIEYWIVKKPKIFSFPIYGFDETYEFSFCEGKLDSITWHN